MAQPPDQPQGTFPFPFRSHTAHLLAAALPFIQPSFRHPIELMTKFLEFSETLKLFQEFHLQGNNPLSSLFQEASQARRENGFFGLINTFITDLEGLLASLSQVCTGDEQEIISMFLNIIRAKNFYDTYGDLIKMSGLFSQNPESSGMSDLFKESGPGAIFSQLFQGGGNPFSGTSQEESSRPNIPPENSQAAVTNNSLEHPAPSAASPAMPSGLPFPGDLTSMLNEEQKETLDLLKSLFASE